MNILITGGAGYLGTELAYTLNSIPSINRVVIYDNLSRKNFNLFLGSTKLDSEKIHFVHGDILDSRRLRKEIEEADIVYHLAAKVSTPFADHNPHEFDQVNNWGTAELSYLLEQQPVKKLIVASSASVYGSSEDFVDINSKVNPKTFYGISKLHGEEHIRRLNIDEMDMYILRIGNVYGYSKSMRFDSVINKFMFEANFTGRVRIYGDGAQMRSFIHVHRLCEILANIATGEVEPSTYNVVEGTYSVNEIVDQLKAIYPDLEMTYVNQNVEMRNLKVKPDYRISNEEAIANISLFDDLNELKLKFSH